MLEAPLQAVFQIEKRNSLKGGATHAHIGKSRRNWSRYIPLCRFSRNSKVPGRSLYFREYQRRPNTGGNEHDTTLPVSVRGLGHIIILHAVDVCLRVRRTLVMGFISPRIVTSKLVARCVRTSHYKLFCCWCLWSVFGDARLSLVIAVQ